MNPINVQVNVKKILADTLTPVSVYLKFRELFPNSILLESSDYHGNENAYSFICIKPMYCFTADQGLITIDHLGKQLMEKEVTDHKTVAVDLDAFFKSFKLSGDVAEMPANGLFGYLSFDSIKYFEKIDITAERKEEYAVPEVKYCFYKYIIAIDHNKDMISLIENLPEGEGVYVYFECDDLNEKVEAIKQKGIKFDQQATDQKWLWREARLKDIDGNQIILFYGGQNRLNPPWRLKNQNS